MSTIGIWVEFVEDGVVGMLVQRIWKELAPWRRFGIVVHEDSSMKCLCLLWNILFGEQGCEAFYGASLKQPCKYMNAKTRHRHRHPSSSHQVRSSFYFRVKTFCSAFEL
jgi:hypothetical protein